MKIILFFLFNIVVFSQNGLHTPENRKLFADYLFCTGDYLRAIDEYEWVNVSSYSDTNDFKILLSLYAIEKYDMGDRKSESLLKNSVLPEFVLAEKMKSLIKRNDYYGVRELYWSSGSEYPVHRKLMNFSYLYTEKDSLPSPPYLSIPFNEKETAEIHNLYNRKINLETKDPVLAGFLSALIPGAGKIYTEEYGDAFFAVLSTGLFAYLAYTSFKADNTFRGVLFSGIGGWFYAGNIYGSAVSAFMFNAKIEFNFSLLLDEYLRVRNYFLPDYRFCK